jgi:DnaK suppressor protein
MLVDGLTSSEHELNALRESGRDPEYEETAQAASAEYTLAQLIEGHRREIKQIDGALERLDDGSYGLCMDCELEIPPERLHAMAYTLRCADCATLQESNRPYPRASL